MGQEISQVELREATVADLEQMDKVVGGDLTKTIKMVELLSGLPPQDIRKMPAKYFTQCAEAVADFLV